jgi:hypothetical protein
MSMSQRVMRVDELSRRVAYHIYFLACILAVWHDNQLFLLPVDPMSNYRRNSPAELNARFDVAEIAKTGYGTKFGTDVQATIVRSAHFFLLYIY